MQTRTIERMITILNPKIYKELLEITPEEQSILDGESVIDLSIYSTGNAYVFEREKLIGKNKLIDIRKHTRFIDFPRHSHDYVEMVYVYQGTNTQEIDGRKITLQTGELVILNQNASHAIEKVGKDDIIINFVIAPEFLDFLFTLTDERNTVFNFLFNAMYCSKNQSEYLYFKVSEVPSIQQCFADVINEMGQHDAIQDVSVKLNVGRLLVELMKHMDCLEVYSHDNYETKLTFEILKYIDSDYQQGSLTYISNVLNVPDYQISRIIKKHTGETFKMLVQEKRLHVASDLLLLTDLSIADVLSKVGYENVTYFYRLFKDKYQMTPFEYRKSFAMRVENSERN